MMGRPPARLADFIDPVTGEVRSDTELEQAVREAVRREWELVPNGSWTVASLEDNIVQRFVKYYGWNINKGATADEIVGDITLHEIITTVNPMARRKVSYDDIAPEPVTQTTTVGKQTVHPGEYPPTKPGYQDAPVLNGEQIRGLVNSLFGFLTEYQKREIEADLARRQAEGKPVRAPKNPETDRILGMSRPMAFGLGAAALLGIGVLAFLVFRKKGR
jgi:hypothetical protein